MTITSQIVKRKRTCAVSIGGVVVGGCRPIVVQSMTNTDTADVRATIQQIVELVRAGSELVRITVDREDAARAVPYIRDGLRDMGVPVPLIGDFHYIGHQLLEAFPSCAEALDKYRINPGNVGFRKKRDRQFSHMIQKALEYEKPVRIGVNWGSLDQEILANEMDANAKKTTPLPAKSVLEKALVTSAISSAKRAEELGLGPKNIIVSCKVSDVQSLISVYRSLAEQSEYALHLGLTEAGMGSKGIVASTAAMAVLLQNGIGDTIRVSLTPEPGGNRAQEVVVAQEMLQTMGLRAFFPQVVSCPGCGRTTSTVFQELAQTIQNFIQDRMPCWREIYPGSENLNIAIMGCVVNGPGESKHADIGISLPGTGETPSAPVFIDGKKSLILRGEGIAEEFKQIVENYVKNRYHASSVNAVAKINTTVE